MHGWSNTSRNWKNPAASSQKDGKEDCVQVQAQWCSDHWPRDRHRYQSSPLKSFSWKKQDLTSLEGNSHHVVSQPLGVYEIQLAYGTGPLKRVTRTEIFNIKDIVPDLGAGDQEKMTPNFSQTTEEPSSLPFPQQTEKSTVSSRVDPAACQRKNQDDNRQPGQSKSCGAVQLSSAGTSETSVESFRST